MAKTILGKLISNVFGLFGQAQDFIQSNARKVLGIVSSASTDPNVRATASALNDEINNIQGTNVSGFFASFPLWVWAVIVFIIYKLFKKSR